MVTTQKPIIGLIGGLSWQSTAEYYRLANEAVGRAKGGLHSARILMRSLDFANVQQRMDDGEIESMIDLIAGEAKALQDAGATILVIGSAPHHIAADKIGQITDIPLVHSADAIARAVKDSGMKRVGILATKFTLREGSYVKRLQDAGLDVELPSETDISQVHHVVYDELCMGKITEDSRRTFRQIMQKLVDDGAEGIILGATEIELLVSEMDADVPIFPGTKIHIEAALEQSGLLD